MLAKIHIIWILGSEKWQIVWVDSIKAKMISVDDFYLVSPYTI